MDPAHLFSQGWDIEPRRSFCCVIIINFFFFALLYTISHDLWNPDAIILRWNNFDAPSGKPPWKTFRSSHDRNFCVGRCWMCICRWSPSRPWPCWWFPWMTLASLLRQWRRRRSRRHRDCLQRRTSYRRPHMLSSQGWQPRRSHRWSSDDRMLHVPLNCKFGVSIAYLKGFLSLGTCLQSRHWTLRHVSILKVQSKRRNRILKIRTHDRVITVVKLEAQGGGHMNLLRRALGVPEQLSLRDMGGFFFYKLGRVFIPATFSG